MATKKSVPKKRLIVKQGEGGERTAPAAVPLMMYRRIALTFIVLVAAALMSVLYFSTVQAVIYIDSTESIITTEFIAGVFETPTHATDVRGRVASVTLGRTATSIPTGASSKEVDGVSTGTVTIYNNLSFVQPLVATTRLLSESGVLFRLKEGVEIPAGGSVEAEVYADESGASGDIDPTRFSIPGLSPVRQEAVYAVSSQAFTGGVVRVAVVSQAEMEEAAAQLRETLLLDAQELLRSEIDDAFTGESYGVEALQKEFTIEPEEEAQSYDITLTIKVTAVFYDVEALRNIAVAKLYEGLGQGQEFAIIKPDAMMVKVEGIDEEAQEGRLHVTLSAPAITSRTSEAIDVGRFVGMTEEEVGALLINEGVASAVEVEFFPFWIATVPRLKDHIYIDIR